MKKLLIGLAMLAGVFTAPALTVDSTVSDHCVLLQNAQNVVKGTTTAGRTVTVKLGGTQVGSATADSSGAYQVSFNPGGANATSRDLVVSDGSDAKTVSDVLVGEVWMVAGQSNAFNQMDPTVMYEDYADAYPGWKAQFECPNVRVVISTPRQSQGGQTDYYQAGLDHDLQWIVCKSANEAQVKKISPLAFFFGKKLAEAKGCPVGVTLVGMGGTAIGYWMTSDAQARIKALRGGDIPFGYTEPKTGENLSKYLTRFDTVAARGCVWAQGETDASVGGADRYRYSLQCLIDDWRSAAHRNNATFPVVVCGPATFGGGPNAPADNPYDGNWEGEGKYSTLRLELEMAATDLLSNIGIVHAIDLSGNATKGYARTLHPTQKEELAARCVAAARKLAYGENVAYRCPNPIEAFFNSDKTKITVRFPASVSLSKNGEYTHVPFRVKNGSSVNPSNVTIGSDGHSLEIVWSGLSVSSGTTKVAYCNVSGTADNVPIYEMRIYDQNGYPIPTFELTVADSSSGQDSHTHTWGNILYTWNSDSTICTAKATCTTDSSHSAVQAVNATLTVTTAATETTAGAGTRTAVFANPFTTQSKNVVIPATSAGGSSPAEEPDTIGGDYEGVQLWANGPYWATKNVGASSETDNGKYFAWGGTKGVDGSTLTFSEACLTSSLSASDLRTAGYFTDDNVFTKSYDAAAANMGGDWRLPTKAEVEAIATNCERTWDDTLKGVWVQGKGAYAANKIFLPASGYYNAGGQNNNKGGFSLYLTTTALGSSQFYAMKVQNAAYPVNTTDANRANGYTVRAVRTTAPVKTTVDWDHPVAAIAEGTTVAAAWPTLAGTTFASAKASSLQAWAKGNGGVAYTNASDILLEAFLLNCANNQSAIEAAKENFRFAAFDPLNPPRAADFDKYGYNGVVTIEGCSDLVQGNWSSDLTGARFYRAVLSL